MIDWEPENLSGKKDKGILRTPITEGLGFDSPKETANVESKFMNGFIKFITYFYFSNYLKLRVLESKCLLGKKKQVYNTYFFRCFPVHLKGEHEGRVFDERDVSFSLGEGSDTNIPLGVEKALEKFIKGETSMLELKPQYGFGAAGHEGFGIPPNANLVYTVTLKNFDQVIIINVTLISLLGGQAL